MNQTTEPKWNFQDNFITIIENAFDDGLCNECISYFNKNEELGNVFTRKDEGTPGTFKKDNTAFVSLQIPQSWELYQMLTDKMHNHFETYFQKYPNDKTFVIEGFRIQKTLPSEGYHVWHSDDNPDYGHKRAVTFLYYLNDIEEGGETEFLYQKQRINAVKGRGVWFPSCYSHVHRGNQPLKDERYIITGWLQFNE